MPSGSVDIGGYEVLNNPAGGPIDSNPWQLAPVPGGMVLTDAGGNSLLRIGDDGAISTVATFASRPLGGPAPTERVPTGLAVGRTARITSENSRAPLSYLERHRSVSAVPEPQTCALMLAGLGAVGLFGRARRRGELRPLPPRVRSMRRRLPCRSSIRCADDRHPKIRLVLLTATDYLVPLRTARLQSANSMDRKRKSSVAAKNDVQIVATAT
jgi:hypothetical protein